MSDEDRCIHTGDDLKYNFRLCPSKKVKFEARCPNDAHLCLSDKPEDSEPILEVFLGGWGNSKSAIRLNKGDNVAEDETAEIVTGDEFRKFWIKHKHGHIQVGKEEEVEPFMSWTNPEPFPISRVGFCTGWGAEGDWKFADPMKYKKPAKWVNGGGDFPKHAVLGTEEEGEPYYVGRAYHQGALLPGKVNPGQEVCKVSYGGYEHEKSDYQVLEQSHPSDLKWVPASGGDLPTGALQGGLNVDGEPLFIGRSEVDGVQVVGKVHPSHGGCFLAHGGSEHSCSNYEVLCVTTVLLK